MRSASVVIHEFVNECPTISEKITSAAAVHMNGLATVLCCSRYSRIAFGIRYARGPSAPNPASCDLSKETFNLVEPARACGRKVQIKRG